MREKKTLGIMGIIFLLYIIILIGNQMIEESRFEEVAVSFMPNSETINLNK